MEEKILDAAIQEFSVNGLRFTMDDVATNLGMSKKTLYKYYAGKAELLTAIVDECFADIKKSEQEVKDDPDLDIVEKIEKIFVVLPEKYKNIGLSKLYQLSEKYPKIYRQVAHYLSTDWDNTIELLEQGIAQGKIRPISIPLLKTMVESTIQQFMASDLLVRTGMTYEEAMDEMIGIVIQGIRV